MSSALPDPSRPGAGPAPTAHIVMLVGNDATRDARVRKSALAAASGGARVTLVALSSDGIRTDTSLGPVRITRVPVSFDLRDAARGRAASRRARGLPLLRPVDDERDRLFRLAAAARQRDGLEGRTATWALATREQTLRGRRYLGRVGARVSRLGWGAADRVRSRVTVAAAWRRVHPEIDDIERAFGPVIDALHPDLIHAHDVEMMPVAARAVARARAQGRVVPWIYDAHEWVVGLSRYAGRTPRRIAAWAGVEREYIGSADAVITVSEELADALQHRYRLRQRPAVVLNIPPVPQRSTADIGGGIREAIGIDGGVPLLVYSGGVQEARGVQTAVAALADLSGVHLAVVAVPSAASSAMRALLTQATALGVADRVHAVEPVGPGDVVDFLRTADIGLIPLRHFPSHEFALANKLFEYLHAGLPMVVSDCRAQAAFIAEFGVGATHRADDPADLARAVREVLAAGPRLRAAVAGSPARDRFTWPRQAARIQQVQRSLLTGGGPIPTRIGDSDTAPSPLPGVATSWEVFGSEPDPRAGLEPPEAPYLAPPREPTLGVGPANSAGQGWAWSQALRTARPDVRTEVIAVRNGVYDYPADITVSKDQFRRDATWALNLREHARETWTHALVEAGRPIFGGLGGVDPRHDIAALQAGGVHVGLVFHGSEIRDPRAHARTHAFSPFAKATDPYTAKLQAVVDRNLELVADLDLPVFVSTPDQLSYLPGATWLPVVVDLDAWVLHRSHRQIPLVVHAPSNPLLKGTAEIEAAVQPFVDAGRVEYRRVTGLQPAQAAGLIRQADIVIDQVLLGLYGVLACEALASGAVVVGLVGPQIRSRVADPIPIVEADPSTLPEVLAQVLNDLPQLAEDAPGRREFVRRWHDGRESASRLGQFIDQP